MAGLADLFSLLPPGTGVNLAGGGSMPTPPPVGGMPTLEQLLESVIRNGQSVIEEDPTNPFGSPQPIPNSQVNLAGGGNPTGGTAPPTGPPPLPTADQLLTPFRDVAPAPEAPPDPSAITEAVGKPGAPSTAGVGQFTTTMDRAQPTPAPAAGNPGLLSRLGGFLVGLGGPAAIAGHRGAANMDSSQNATLAALMARGVSEADAQAAIRNPQMQQALLTSVFRPRTTTVAPGASVVTDTGQELYRNTGLRTPLSPTDLRGLRDEGSGLNLARRTASSFRDDFAVPGMPGAGNLSNWLASNLPESVTSGPQRERAQWWRDYQRNTSLIERHALFGAALTPAEQASWHQADINPSLNASTIRANLETRQRLLEGGVGRYVRSLVAAGQDPAPILEATGLTMEQITGNGAGSGSGSGRRRYNPTTGRLE